MRAAIYARVSSDRQRREATIETQIDADARYCERAGFTVAAVLRDDGLSGTVEFDQRPGGAELLRLARSGAVDVVVVYDTSRLGRDDYAVITPLTVAYLRSLGLSIHTPGGALEDTPEGNLLLSVKAGLDSYYRADFARKARDGKRRALLQEHRYMGSMVAYGHTVRDGLIVVDREPIDGLGISRADVIGLIYRLCAHERYSLRRISEHLNALGAPPPKPKLGKARAQWLDTTIARILHCTTHVGRMQVRVGGERYEIPVEPIVGADLFAAAQAALAANRNPSDRERWRIYPLNGTLVCGACGHGLHGTSMMPAARKYYYYACYGKEAARRYPGEARCEAPRVRAEPLEARVWSDILQVAGTPGELARRIARHLESLPPAEEDPAALLAGLAEALARKDSERDAVITLLRRGRIRQDALERQLAQIDAEEAALHREIGELQERARAGERASAAAMELQRTLDSLAGILSPETPPAEQRTVIRRLLRRVSLSPTGDLHFEYRV